MREDIIILCFTFVVMITILSGCTNTASTTSVSLAPTPQIIYITVLVTPTPTSLIPTPPAEQVTRYTPYHMSTHSSASPFTISGYGDETIRFSLAKGGRFLVTGSNSGNNYFIVHVIDDEDEIEEFVFNKFGLGPFSGRTIIQLDPGTHYLDVRAEGSWLVSFSSI